MKKALIIGAGPAGLTAACELLRQAPEYEVIVFEESDCFGGISRTVNYKGNRMDMGGHRFFSKVPAVNEWWDRMLPLQGSPSSDDRLLGRESFLKEGGPDPEKTDRVMLKRKRISRIYFNSRFFDYPISLKLETLRNMGFFTTLAVGFSYLKTLFFKRKEDSLEDFYINRFGKKLYEMFFENYTENLWGRHPRDISPEWGAQRVKGLSIKAILKDITDRITKKKNRTVETSLIEEFSYPKLGPGELWELAAEEVMSSERGTVIRGARVCKLLTDRTGEEIRLTGLCYEKDGVTHEVTGDLIISSMPLKDLTAALSDVPADIADIAAGLPYRDYMTLGVLVKKLKLQNETREKTIGGIIPDNWVYVHDRRVKMGRFQLYNNWSPYMVKDLAHTVWLGLEYFCDEGDDLWSLSDEAFAELGIREMETIGLIEGRDVVLDYHTERVKKAYPAYFDTYAEIGKLRAYLDRIPNLYCVGRNGQHRYNNIDHSMCTSFEAVKNILSGRKDKSNIWNVNTEQEYHEQQK
ncbi:MAG: NAD(P)/FAD-dependent oxidoreductase [Lachnospiraceae bacterium]|nr:NAD(P)/FAD-dependent oxidoreductase [Lachnospiraceae bacterium]